LVCSGVYGRSVSDNHQDGGIPGAVASKTSGVSGEVEDLTRVKRGFGTTLLDLAIAAAPKVYKWYENTPEAKAAVKALWEKAKNKFKFIGNLGKLVNALIDKIKKKWPETD